MQVQGFRFAAEFGSVLLRMYGESVKKPVVLMASTERWTATARLALALRSLGCEIALLSPGDHPANVSGAVTRQLRYDPLRPLHSLHLAIRAVQPTVLLPSDETMTRQVGELWERMKVSDGVETKRLQALLNRSLGDPDRLSGTGSRILLQHAADAEGVPTPATLEITRKGELATAFDQLGSPMMLKADSSSGGRGVRTVETMEEAERAWAAFSVAPRMPRALMRGVLRREWTHLRSAMRKEKHGVTAQRKINGPERTAMAVAYRGELLALEMFEVVHSWKERGPSSVLRRVQDHRMERSIRALVAHLEITGFTGFDFIVDGVSGESLLLERNARPTQVSHLSFGDGHDLAAAYVRAIVGRTEVRDRAAATGRQTIALFPQELQRDRESPVLQTAFHDVPWESPALLSRALRGQPALRVALDNLHSGKGGRQESGISWQVAR